MILTESYSPQKNKYEAISAFGAEKIPKVNAGLDEKDIGVKISQLDCDDLFDLTFNRDLDVDYNEASTVLFELHENSLLYMDREEWDRALILLQKAHHVMEQVNLDRFKKDKLISVIIFNNTALWFQMQGSLEEASVFMESAVLNLEVLTLMPEFQTPSLK